MTDDNGTRICIQPTQEEMEFYSEFSWWLEGFGQTVLGCLGFIGNSIAIPILLSKNMSNIFNRMLTCLAIADNIFIICSVLEAIRKYFGSTELHLLIFGSFLYQFHNMILCCSTYLTVMLAMERYKAVWRPVEYRNNVLSSLHPWRRVLTYVAPVVLLSVLFNIPKFFETTMFYATYTTNVTDPITNVTTAQEVEKLTLATSPLRLNRAYVLWYSNVARLLVTGFIPLGLMTYFNFQIYQLLKRRRRMNNRPNQAAQHAQQKHEETKQAIVLFAIVVLFMICHAVRIVLNIHEVFNIEEIRISMLNGCYGQGLARFLGTSISHFLITLNASVNFFIYCLMSEPFRQTLRTKMGEFYAVCFPRKNFPCWPIQRSHSSPLANHESPPNDCNRAPVTANGKG